MGRTRKTAPKIWPGPERLKSTPIKRVDHVLVLDRRGEPEHETTVASVGQHFVEVPSPTRPGFIWLVDPKRVVPVHVYGIALARTKARARMERFLAWLDSRHAPRSLIAYAGKHLSPEAAVSSMMRADVRHYLCNVFACMGANITRTPCPGCQPVLAASLLASPEWASLPWQADPKTP